MPFAAPVTKATLPLISFMAILRQQRWKLYLGIGTPRAFWHDDHPHARMRVRSIPTGRPVPPIRLATGLTHPHEPATSVNRQPPVLGLARKERYPQSPRRHHFRRHLRQHRETARDVEAR